MLHSEQKCATEMCILGFTKLVFLLIDVTQTVSCICKKVLNFYEVDCFDGKWIYIYIFYDTFLNSDVAQVP